MVYEKDETFITECGQDLSEDRLVARERRIVFYQLQRLDRVVYSLQLSALYEGMRRRRDYSSGSSLVRAAVILVVILIIISVWLCSTHGVASILEETNNLKTIEHLN